MSESNETNHNDTGADNRDLPHMHDPNIQLRDHVYDGIQEYDQRLPNWWLFTFYIAVAFFLLYWVLYYQFGAFHTDKERIDAAMTRIETIKAEALKERMSDLNNDVFWDMSKNDSMVTGGQVTYMQICHTCHGANLDGQGPGGVALPGLPLNDKEWKYGGEPMQVFDIVMNGSPDVAKGMAAWNTLGTDKVVEVVAFLLSKHEKPGDGEAYPQMTDEGRAMAEKMGREALLSPGGGGPASSTTAPEPASTSELTPTPEPTPTPDPAPSPGPASE